MTPRPVLPGFITVVAVGVLLSSCTAPSSPFKPGNQAVHEWAQPAENRPKVDLEFRVAADLQSVTGTEQVAFTPDLEVCELVFRAWPNKPATSRSGNSLRITSVRVDGQVVEPEVSSAGAPHGKRGTLIEVPLPRCVPAGTEINAALGFDLQLGSGTDERVGVSRTADLAWFGTAYPLLAWENGLGWARDEAVPVTGETVTSETFNLTSLRVIAPEEYAVLGVGEARPPVAERSSGLMIHEFSAPALRDVTVTVGKLRIVEKKVGDTTIHLGGPEDQLTKSLDEWVDTVASTVESVSDYLGPVPYDNVWVSVIPDQSEGIEFPGAIQFGQLTGARDRWLVTHEVAHMWFYGLVGNNQARDPWLDESFASYVQRVVDDPNRDPATGYDYPDRVATSVGLPMSDWADFRRADSAYVSGVYQAGADMLIEARRAAGASSFDAALRQYLAANAHRIATPGDVRAGFASLPGVVRRMEAAGALGD